MSDNTSGKFMRFEIDGLPKYRKMEIDARFRSLEKFLEKHKYQFSFDDSGCSVFVENREESQRLGLLLNLAKATFYDGSTLHEMSFKEIKKVSPRKIIIDTLTGNKYTYRQYKNLNEKEAKKTCLTKSKIISLKLMTKTVLENAIKEGKLDQIQVGNNYYIERAEITKFLGLKFKS